MISTLTNQAMRGPLEYAKTIAYSSEEVLIFTYRMAQKYANSPGVYVECGVAAGAQVIAMAPLLTKTCLPGSGSIICSVLDKI